MNRKNFYFLFSLLLVSVIPYFILSFYTHPAGDDFVYAYNGKHFGIIENAVRDYFQWSGRYISNVLVVLNPLEYDSLFFYRLASVAMIILIPVSFYFLIHSMMEKHLNNFSSVICSFVFTILFLFQMPSLAQGIYWYTGAVVHQAVNVLMLIYLALLINFLKGKYFINKIIHGIICLLFIFLITGFNEIAMLFLFAFHFIIYLKLKRRDLLFFLLFSVLCSLLVIISPGSSARGALFPERHLFFHSLLFSLMQCIRFFIEWISGIPLMISSLIYIPVSIQLSQKSDLFKNNFYLSLFLTTSFLFLVIFLSVFPPYWSTGILGQHRSVNSAYFFFIILWFMDLTVWINYFREKKILQIVSDISLKKFKPLFLLMILFSLITKNGYRAMSDLISGREKKFDKEMSVRYQVLKEIKSSPQKICILDSLQNKPASLFVLDITKNENDWMNRGMAAYFGIEKVKLK